MPTAAVDLAWCRDWFRRNRERSRAWFGLLRDDAYFARPISLRHPLVFYEGHLPAFNVNTLVKRGLGLPGVAPDLETLFERGIDPGDGEAGPDVASWPTRSEVGAFAAACDRLVEAAFEAEGLCRADDPMLHRGLALFTILEHEAMHHETLLYMFHRLPTSLKVAPRGYRPIAGGEPPAPRTVEIPAGRATLGVSPDDVVFGWDNEFSAHDVDVPAFAIDVHDVTNREFLAFVEGGGYEDPALWTAENWAWREREGLRHPSFWSHREGRWHWRGLFADVPLPPAWPVYVSHAEAEAYARWRGARLCTEAEYHRAAFGAPTGGERAFPWGSGPPGARHGNFGLRHWDPLPVGSHPEGASAWGVHDLVGNGWEWTATVFAPFPGFTPTPSYPRYSADFFDGGHYVMKGASPATASELLRRSWRNWFRPRYPYPYATFRCVRS
ncbi:MAG: ergothioneine biosynthesis protein EgtB [Deltaproteobacteria bacterium]|nr:ergothioneine biosynthesis protein EgtB [Deltaproteobacteria bacterium]